MKAWETPQGSRHSRGTHIRNLLENLQEDEDIVSILPISKDIVDEVTEKCLKVKLGEVKSAQAPVISSCLQPIGPHQEDGFARICAINRNGKYALRFKLENDSLVNVQQSVDTDDVVMISTTGYASRFKCEAIRTSGRVSGGVYGIKVADRKGSGGGFVAGMLAMSDSDSQILTISKYGMAKRSRLGTADDA